MTSTSMSVREATLFTVQLRDGKTYETFEWRKAEQRSAFFNAAIPAAECVDCGAIIPVELVDLPFGSTRDFLVGGVIHRLGNACPANHSLTSLGHRVTNEDYEEKSKQ